MTLKYKIFKNTSLENLIRSQKIVQEIIIRLGGVRKQGFGITIGTGPDHPGVNELKAFKAMRSAFAFKIKTKVKSGSAIASFIKNGISGKPGNYRINEKALNKLHNTLKKELGPSVALQATKSIKQALKNQIVATKKVVALAAKKLKRSIKAGLTQQDKAVINILNNNNNFFISGIYDKTLIGSVNTLASRIVQENLPKSALASLMREELPSVLAQRGNTYLSILASDVINRARNFAQVTAFEEARIRKYEIIAVMDERTSEICEAMDGMVFEVELARKIVKDIQENGIPDSRSDSDINAFKALRPWLNFDSVRAEQGKPALFYGGPKGEKIYLPNSTFKATDKGFKPAKKITSQEVVETAPRGGNPPALPPFHAHCRSSVVISEEDVKIQDWEEAQGV